MAEFIYTTSIIVYRPVFIEADKLESLDKILDEEWLRLRKHNESLIDAEVEKELNNGLERLRYSSRLRGEEENFEEAKQKRKEELRERLRSRLLETRSITIHLKGNKKTVVPSFSDALRQPALLDEVPVRFDTEIRSGDIRCDIGIDRDGDLSIRVSPEHLPESREMFASLQRWASSVRPPTWQRWWVVLNPLQWLLFFIVIMVAVGAVADSGYAYREQALQLLKDGLTQDEQLKAIELTLLLEGGFVPTGQGNVPIWFKSLLIGGFILCATLSITPKSMIGIGKGEGKINHWRTWLRLIFFLVPGLIFTQILLPYLLRWLGIP